MRWVRLKRKVAPASQVEAMEAQEQAQQQLEDAHDMHAEALTLVETLRQIRQRNHFGQSLENINWSKP